MLSNIPLSRLLFLCAVVLSIPVATSQTTNPIHPVFYTFTPDLAKCASPYCGGYFLDELNPTDQKHIYVAGFKFITSDRLNTSIVNTALTNNIVLRGQLVPHESVAKMWNLEVSDLYVALPRPSLTSAPTGDYYSLTDTKIRCENAGQLPCPSASARKLNSNIDFIVSGIFQPYSYEISHLDSRWMYSRIFDTNWASRAIVQAVRTDLTNIHINRVFIRLPDPFPECPPSKTPSTPCPQGQVSSYVRHTTRCISFAGCVDAGLCSQSTPVCPAGYRVASFPSTSFGCLSYFCDAIFLSPTFI
eukprot:gene8047-9455_t